MIDYDFTKTADEARLELRAYGASGGVYLRRGQAWGGSAFVHPRSLAGGAYAVAQPIGVGFYAALRPVRWVAGGWSQWVPAMYDAASRAVSLFATRDEVEWRWWVPVRPLSERRPNTPREGFASWARVFLGRLTERTLANTTRTLPMRMPEGTYAVKVTHRVEMRDRERWFPRITATCDVRCDVGVAVPPKGKDLRAAEYKATYDHGDVEQAVRDFRASITKRRGHWTPPRRFAVLNREGTALQERDPVTGKWSPTDVTPTTLPAGSVVDPPEPFPWYAIAAIGCLGIGLLRGALAEHIGGAPRDAAEGGAAAMADRR